MACLITSGRLEPCKDSAGGLKFAYFLNYEEDSFTVVAGEATAINVAVTEVFRYVLNADANVFTETVTSDRNTGVTSYAQSLTLSLKKQTKDSAVEFHLMATGRPVIVIQDRLDNYRVMGLRDGTTLSGDNTSGGAVTDFNGYQPTFTATEILQAPYLDSATVTALLAIVSATNIDP